MTVAPRWRTEIQVNADHPAARIGDTHGVSDNLPVTGLPVIDAMTKILYRLGHADRVLEARQFRFGEAGGDSPWKRSQSPVVPAPHTMDSAGWDRACRTGASGVGGSIIRWGAQPLARCGPRSARRLCGSPLDELQTCAETEMLARSLLHRGVAAG